MFTRQLKSTQRESKRCKGWDTLIILLKNDAQLLPVILNPSIIYCLSALNNIIIQSSVLSPQTDIEAFWFDAVFSFKTSHQWTSATPRVCQCQPDAASCRLSCAEASPFSDSPWCSSTRSSTWDKKDKVETQCSRTRHLYNLRKCRFYKCLQAELCYSCFLF